MFVRTAITFAAVAIFACAGTGHAFAAESATTTTITDLVVVLIDEAAVTASTEGTVREVLVAEGDSVEANDLIVHLDDARTKLERSLAQRALQIAEQQRDATDALDASQATVAEREQLVVEHQVRSELNRERSKNDLKIKAAEKAELVAQNEWARAKDARSNFSDAVSQSEIESLRLAFERTRLETLEAKFQQRMTEIEVKLDTAIGKSLRLKKESALVQQQAALSAEQIDKLKTEIESLHLELANEKLESHHLRTPIDGTVVATRVRVGDWVRPGQTVARVINTKRLRVEGFAKASDAELIRRCDEIQILISQPDGGVANIPGGRKFVSPEIDAVTGEVRFWVEFQNNGGIHPGSNARIEVHR
ncbi:HlyD family secretion protein [Rhodopirellula sallentina]|uniref:Secretion protein HlyD family protein n=1 Tax=Rhodopirellula sallentina SM41 TaxID=1263870 RepID=M5UJS8_9BACT|nr:HlyD family efflux transporter periplasmic adaptor subunit [Rhodopirellula sallentina]EMI56258.1 secretion protein HlyD family protein [Rhodopirellula sallentina SM41]